MIYLELLLCFALESGLLMCGVEMASSRGGDRELPRWHTRAHIFRIIGRPRRLPLRCYSARRFFHACSRRAASGRTSVVLATLFLGFSAPITGALLSGTSLCTSNITIKRLRFSVISLSPGLGLTREFCRYDFWRITQKPGQRGRLRIAAKALTWSVWIAIERLLANLMELLL